MSKLFSDLDQLTHRVSLTRACYYQRASYHTKPFKSLLESLLKAFVERGPLTELFRLAVQLDVNLQDKGFLQVYLRLQHLLDEAMSISCKDLEGFVVVVQAFIAPVLAVGSTNFVQ